MKNVITRFLDETRNHPWINFDIPSILDEVASEKPIILHVRIWLNDTLNWLPNNSWMDLGISLVLGEVCDAHVVVGQVFLHTFF
jgi:hypothetical protein